MKTVIESKARSRIKSVEILGLFGKRDYNIDFDNGIRIVVGENGSGKTTILNIVHAAIIGNKTKLSNYDFKDVIVKYSDGDSFVFSKKDHARGRLRAATQYKLLDVIQDDLKSDEFYALKRYVDSGYISYKHKVLIDDMLYNNDSLRKYVNSICPPKKNRGDSGKVVSSKVLNSDCVLFFPTYRRIEDDLGKMGVDKALRNKIASIEFGMSDVAIMIGRITDNIKALSVAQFHDVSGDMLNKLACGCGEDETSKETFDPESVDVVLGRLGERIEPQAANMIRNAVRSQTDFWKKNKMLSYLLGKLLDAYNKQKETDNSINGFCNSCNKFLLGKKFYYNPHGVAVEVVRDSSDKKMELEEFSSGEKQVVSLMSKIFLGSSSPYVVIIDEPELSLSIHWQKALLQEIVCSGKCSDMFIVTHSPFIFDNSLDAYAKDIDSFEVKK